MQLAYEPFHIVENSHAVSALILVFRFKFSFPFFAAGLEEGPVGLCTQ